MNNIVLKLIRNSNIVAKLYVNIVLLLYWVLHKINTYDALKILCDVLRRVPDMNITSKCSALIRDIVEESSCENGTLLPIQENKLLISFYKSRSFVKARNAFANESELDLLHLRHYRANSSPLRQGNIIILKKYIQTTGEKGVIVLKYTPTFEHFASVFNIISILKEYRVVFEPSSYRNIEPSIFLFSGKSMPQIFQAAQNDDKVVLKNINTSINCIDLGSGDWIDFNSFCPMKSKDKIYDIVMVASWSNIKRHEVLFKALATLKKRGRVLKVALIGYPMELKKSDIAHKSKKYGVEMFCDFFEQIPQLEVAKIVSSSMVAVHLSKAEGTNKASYEAMMCDVPLIVYKHNIGFRNSFINQHTGMFADDEELPDVIEYMLDNYSSYSPREWILKYSGYINSSNKLNAALKSLAIKNNEAWGVDIVQKINNPNFIYVDEEDCFSMESEYNKLKKHLI